MLKIRYIMNSDIEEVLAFKTCCNLKMFDQNLEIHITNQGDRPVRLPSYFDLETLTETKRITTLTPSGEQVLPPGELMAFYCFMDESLWDRAQTITFYDKSGNRYSVRIIH
jgi:hypothetical protein